MSERSWNTVFQILFENNIEQLKILYKELRSQFPLQDYRLIKKAIKEEKNKCECDRNVKSVLCFFEKLIKERKKAGKKRRNKTKNIKKAGTKKTKRQSAS